MIKAVALGFWVEGRPFPQGSKKAFATKSGKINLVEVSKGVKGWRENVRQSCRRNADIDGYQMPDREQPMAVEIELYMPRNQSENRSKNHELRNHTRRPDIDKLARAILDAITGIAFHDDSQVAALHVTKRLAEPWEAAGAYVRVAPRCI